MIEKMFVLIFILALGLLSSLADYNRIEPTDFHYELGETKQAKNPSDVRMHVVLEKNDQLQRQIEEITQSRNQLKAQVAKLKQLSKQADEPMQFRLELQKKNNDLTKSLDAATAEAEAAKHTIEELTQSRDIAIAEARAAKHTIEKLTLSRDSATAEAKAAKLEIDELKNKLEAKMEEIRGLQEQLKQVQGDVEELQSVLKP